MKSIREQFSEAVHDALGGKSIEQCATEAQERWRNGLGVVWPRGPKHDAPPGEIVRIEEGPEAKRQHLARCAVPERIAEVLCVGLKDTPAVVAVREWLESKKTLLILHGDVDAGKSVAAASMFLHARKTVHWDGGREESWDSSGCAFELASEAAKAPLFGDEARSYWGYLGRARWLVIDDVGAEVATDHWLSALDGMLNERFGRLDTRTIITTNVSCRRQPDGKPSPFEQRYGARIARRVREAGSVAAVAKGEM